MTEDSGCFLYKPFNATGGEGDFDRRRSGREVTKWTWSSSVQLVEGWSSREKAVYWLFVCVSLYLYTCEKRYIHWKWIVNQHWEYWLPKVRRFFVGLWRWWESGDKAVSNLLKQIDFIVGESFGFFSAVGCSIPSETAQLRCPMGVVCPRWVQVEETESEVSSLRSSLEAGLTGLHHPKYPKCLKMGDTPKEPFS